MCAGIGSNPISCLHNPLIFKGFFVAMICALLFYVLSITLFQSFIHDIKILLFYNRVVNVAKGCLLIYVNEDAKKWLKEGWVKPLESFGMKYTLVAQ